MVVGVHMIATCNLDWGLVVVVDGGCCCGHLKVLELAGVAEWDMGSFGQFHLESHSCLCTITLTVMTGHHQQQHSPLAMTAINP